MAKPRVFISSTFYDLKQIRTDLDNFIRGLGYDVVRNEEGGIPYGTNENLEDYCYNEIASIDILVAIIGGRFGSVSREDNYSISNEEIKTAISHNKQVYIFIEKDVDAEYYTYLKNKSSNIVYSHADDVRIYQFIEEIRSLKKNNIIHTFMSSGDIISFLKEQWAGLFQKYLQYQSNITEIDTIKLLNDSLNTVQDITKYLTEQSKTQNERIEDYLIYNHPLFAALRKVMNWKFPIVFHSLNDLSLLLEPWGYHFPQNTNKEAYYMYTNSKFSINVYINKKCFSKEGKLLAKTDVGDEEQLVFKESYSVNDDLPF
jgi:hypothetical protein